MERRPVPYAVGADDDDGELLPRAVILAGRREDRRRRRLEQSTRVRVAAIVADTFHLDPVAVLEEPDPLRRLIRIAAHNVVQNEATKAARRAARK